MAGNLIATYSPSRVSVSLGIVGGNQIPLVGWADDEFITVERNAEFFSVYVGVMGEYSRAASRDTSGLITLRFQHTSPSIKYIENLKTADAVLAAGGIGAPPVMTLKITDPSSPDNVFSSACWLHRDSPHSWGKDVATREYQLWACNVTTAANETLSILQNIANLTGLL